MNMSYSILCVTSLLAVALWSVLSIRMLGLVFEMDPGGKHSFYPMFTIYRQTYAAIFLSGIVLATVTPSPDSRLLEALAAIYAMLFVLWLTFCYESYQHARYNYSSLDSGKSCYTGRKYAVTLTLGVMSPFLFVLGLLMGAVHGS